ncbi:MAG: hypothetical protein ACTSYZ_01485, partial [Candidatus Helarchaeota archaeon]
MIKRKNNFYLMIFFFILIEFSFSIISYNLNFIGNNYQVVNNPFTINNDYSYTDLEYSGPGINIKIGEQALNTSSFNGLTPSDSIYGTVPATWTGYETYLSISNLRESGQWVDNPMITTHSNWYNSKSGDTSDIDFNFNADNTPGGGGDSLEIIIKGWESTKANQNIDFTSNLNGWNQYTGTSAYGDPDEDTPDTVGHDTSHGDGGVAYFYHDVYAPDGNSKSEGPSVKWNQTITLSTTDIIVTKAYLSYSYRIFDTANSWGQNPQNPSGFAIGHVYINSVEFDGTSYTWPNAQSKTVSNKDVTSILQSGSSWTLAFGFECGLQIAGRSTWLGDQNGYIDANGWFNYVNLTIIYQKKINTGSEAFWNQTTSNSLKGRSIISSNLNFAFRGNNTISGGASSYIWAQVGSNGKWGSKHYISYQGTYQFLSNIETTWRQADPINILGDLSTLGTTTNLTIRLGVTTAGLDFNSKYPMGIRFDNITINMVCELDPDDSNVNMNVLDVSHGSAAYQITGSYGSGTATINDNWNSNKHRFDFSISSSFSVTFNAYLRLNETKVASALSNFTISSQDMTRVTWWIYFDPTSLANLTSFSFNVTVPNDWDPNRIWIPGSAVNYEIKNQTNYMLVIKPSDVNQNNTMVFYKYFTENNDGLWKIRLYAPNYIYDIKSQIETAGTWTDSNKFYPNNNSRTQIFINTSYPWTQGMASRTVAQIEDVNQTQVNIEIRHDFYSSITSSVYNMTWLVAPNSIGTYRSIVRWNNSISGSSVSKIGFNYINFEVWRKTNVFIYIDKSFDYGNSYLQPSFLPFKARWSDQLSNAVSNGHFYIEYNSTSYVLVNYTSYTEGRNVNKGNYTINLPTSALKAGPQNVTCYLFKKYFDSIIRPYFINQTVDVSADVITPQQKWNLTTYYAETLEINDYNITVQFYDEFEQANIKNGTSPWTNVEVKIDYLNGTIDYFSLKPDGITWYYEINTAEIHDHAEYRITMNVVESSPYQYKFETQTFNVRIQIVYSDSDLDLVRTSIDHPPSGSGWLTYNNITDLYSAQIYWNESFEVKVYFFNITSEIGVDNAKVNLTGWPDISTILDLNSIGGGFYKLDINANNEIIPGTYNLRINASAPGYQSREIYLTLYILNRSTQLIRPTYSFAYVSIPWNDSFTLEILYQDTVNSPYLNLSGPQVSISVLEGGHASSLNWSLAGPFSNNTYKITFHGNISDLSEKHYYLSIKASKNNWTTRYMDFEVIITPIKTELIVDPSIISNHPRGNNKTISITYRDLDHTIDLTGNVEVNWSNDGNDYYSISNPLVSSYGYYYQIEINTSWTSIRTYYINITVSKPHYITKSYYVEVQIRPRYTQVIYDVPQIIKWGKNATLNVYLKDLDNNQILSPSVIYADDITINETQGVKLTYSQDGNGYLLDIDTRDISKWPVGRHQLNVTIYSAYGYYNSSTLIDIIIATRETNLIYLTPDIVPYLYNLTLKFRYTDQDNTSGASVGINNDTNPQIPWLTTYAGNVSISFQVFRDVGLTDEVSGLIYWIFSMKNQMGNGWYNITLDTSSLGLTGGYYAQINVSWISDSLYYNKSIIVPFNIRNITSLLEYIPPGSVKYVPGSFGIDFRYTNLDEGGSPISGAELNVTAIYDINDVNITSSFYYSSNYTVNYQGNGWYELRIFMGPNNLHEFGTYKVSVKINKTNYDSRTISNITFTIRRGYTQFTSPFAPASQIIDGLTNITINYIDAESGEGIVNSTGNVILRWNWLNASHPNILFVYGWNQSTSSWAIGAYSGDDGRYQFLINASTALGLVIGGKYYLTLNISAGSLVQSKELNITFRIQPQTSIMGVDYPIEVVWNVNATFNVTYTKLDGSVISDTTISLYCIDFGTYWNSSYWSYFHYGNGVYNVTVNTSLYAPPNSGYFTLRVDASSANYTDRSMNVIMRVRPIDTQVILTPPTATSYGELANITIKYWDTYYSSPISDVGTITDKIGVYINCTNIDPSYWNVYVGASPGYYILSINTTVFGSLSATGHLVQFYVKYTGEPYYQNWSGLSLNLIVQARNTELSYTPPLQVPYGTNITVSLSFIDLDLNPSQGIENANIYVIYNSHFWNSSGGYAWVNDLGNGIYNVIINTSKLPQYGSYSFTFQANWSGTPFYNNRSVSMNINVRQIYTILTYIIPAPSAFGLDINFEVVFSVSDSEISSLNGQGLDNCLINITSLYHVGSGIIGLTYGTDYLISPLGNGTYTITITGNKLMALGTYNITILASRYNLAGGINYQNSTAFFEFSVRNHYTEILYNPIGNIPWNTTTSLTIAYHDTDNSSNYLNIDNTILLINGSNSNYGSITNLGTNYFKINDLTIFYNLPIGEYTLNITLYNVQNYSSATKIIPFSIRERNTEILYEPVGNIPWNLNTSLILTWHDTDVVSNYLIINRNRLLINNTQNFGAISYIGNNKYLVSDVSILLGKLPGTYTLNITLHGVQNYSTTSKYIGITIRERNTEILYQPLGNIPWNTTTYLIVKYHDVDNGSNYLDIDINNVLINGSRNFGTIIAIGNNQYRINDIQLFLNLPIGSYNLNVTLFNVSNYQSSSKIIPFSIRERNTEILYEPIGNIPWGLNTSLTLAYHDVDVVSNYLTITSLNILINGTTQFGSISDLGNGYFRIEDIYFVTALSVGTHVLNITLYNIQNYSSSEKMISFNIRNHLIELNYDPPEKIPWSENLTLTIQYYDIDNSSYPNIPNNNSVLINGSRSNFGYLIRSGNSYIIYDIYTENLSLGSYELNLTISVPSYVVATKYISITVRNRTTTLTYEPVGVVPYSDTVNTTISINYIDEFGLGINNATVQFILLLENGSSTTKHYVLGVNWTYSYQGSGDYLIEFSIAQLSELKYTFKITIWKQNYVERIIPSFNITIRPTYTQFRSPQWPSAVVPQGEFNISLYYEDREAGIRISNDSGDVEIYYHWNNDTLNTPQRSRLIQVGSGSNTYWVLWINTSGFSLNDTYNVTLNASKPHYEFQELSINIIISEKQVFMTTTTPPGTVWGQNMTFIVTYTDSSGNEIPSVSITINWSRYKVTSLGGGDYQVELNTSEYVLPQKGYYDLNVTANAPDYMQSSQVIKLFIRPIDSNILYDPPATTPYMNNLSFEVTYRDTFHSRNIYSTSKVIISTNITSSYWKFEYLPSTKNYIITINTSNPQWNNIPGSYEISLSINWTGQPYYQNTTINILINIRLRSAEISYTPPDSVPWGFNLSSLIIWYKDMDASGESYPIISNNSLLINESAINFAFITRNGDDSYTIHNIDLSNFTNPQRIILVIKIIKNYYANASRNIIVTIRRHYTSLTYIPPNKVPYGDYMNLTIQYYDIDTSSYPLINLNSSALILKNLTGHKFSHSYVYWQNSSQSYLITNIDVRSQSIGIHSINITIINDTYYIPATVIGYFEMRRIRTALQHEFPAPFPYGNNLTMILTFVVSDVESSKNGLLINNSLINITTPGYIYGTNYSVIDNHDGTYNLTIYTYQFARNTYQIDLRASTWNFDTNSANATSSFTFTIRQVITSLTYRPIQNTPFGNNVTFTILYNISDSASGNNGQGLNVSGWKIFNGSNEITEHVHYTWNGSNGVFTFSISNTTLANKVGYYTFTIYAYSSAPEYKNASITGMQFYVRPLITTFIYDPVPQIPYGNPASIYLYYKVTDSESLYHNGEFISGANINITNPTWTSPDNYTVQEFSTNYTINVLNTSINNVQFYYLDITASVPSQAYQSASITGLPIQVRALTTALTYVAVVPVPWGNNASITLFYKVSDPQSLYHNNELISGGIPTITYPSGWIRFVNYTYREYPTNYTVSIDNNTINIVQDYTISITFSASSIYANASITSLPFTVRSLATNLFYDAVPDTPWGNDVNLTIRYLVKDPASLYHNNELVLGGNLTIISPSSWTIPSNYSVFEYSDHYIIDINNNTINTIGNYLVSIQASTSGNIYG